MDDELIDIEKKKQRHHLTYKIFGRLRMTKQFRVLSIIILSCLTFVFFCNSAIAQDTGKPAMQTIAYYTIGGGVLGAGLGIAYWMLDPLAPSADLRQSVLQGYGIGVFFGVIFGALQLNKQAVFPYSEPELPSEFEGGAQNLPFDGNSFRYSQIDEKPKAPEVPILNFQYRF